MSKKEVAAPVSSSSAPPLPLISGRLHTYLCQFPGEVISEKLFFLLIVKGQCLFLLLQQIDLLEESVGDELFFLLCLGLLQRKERRKVFADCTQTASGVH